LRPGIYQNTGGIEMKKIITITLIVLLAATFLIAGNERAEAMNNESAALLTAGLVLFGQPVVKAVAREIMYPGGYYEPAYPAHYRDRHEHTRYIERTKVIYVEPRHQRLHRHRDWAYERGHRDEWCRHDYKKGRHYARRDYRYYRDDDND